MHRSITLWLALLAVASIWPGRSFAQPTMVSFQGSLMKGTGSNRFAYDGPADFRFAILCGGQIVWNSDAGSSQNGDPVAAATLQVSRGIFSVLLGDSAHGMPPVTASVLGGCTGPTLRVWVDTGDGSEQLPDQPIASSAYAIQADTATNGGAGGPSLDDLRLEGPSPDISVPTGSILQFGHWNGSVFTEHWQMTSAGRLYMRDAIGQTTVQVYPEESGGGGQIVLANGAGVPTIELDAHRNSNAADVRLFTETGVEAVRLTVDDGTGSSRIKADVVEVNQQLVMNANLDVSTDVLVHVGQLKMYDSLQQQTVEIRPEESGGGGQLRLFNGSGAPTIELDGHRTNGAPDIRLFTPSGATAVHIRADDGTGSSRIIADVLQLNGADLSENFDIGSVRDAVEPGMVVCIDPERPGALVESRSAYDRKVAGVVSGAGGIRSGLMMQQSETVASGDHPVALTGRVYVMADASYGPIAAGDLLTTSDTPGHAMRVGNHERAQGAILGKAMTGLESGRGLILTLVTLQ